MDKIFKIQNLDMFYPITKGFGRRIIGHVKAINDLTFDICAGETLGVVGESGCGKTTLGGCIIRLLEPSSGSIVYHQSDGVENELVGIKEKDLRFYRKEAQMIFQDPYSSLNPRMTVKDLVSEPLIVNGLVKKQEINERVANMLNRMGLRSDYMKRYPHAFSGGQRQRISIARSLIVEPRFVVCDEVVSSLDVSVQAQIIELLKELQEQSKYTYLFISHDLSVIRYISDRVMVMYLGHIVELCATEELFDNTRHPYTKALIDSVPDLDPSKKIELNIIGEVGDASKENEGCNFYPRCKIAVKKCSEITPELYNCGSPEQPHYVRCHFAMGG